MLATNRVLRRETQCRGIRVVPRAVEGERVTPANLTTEQWQQVSTALVWFWAFLGSVVGFAAFFLVSYAIIPSLVSTRDLPSRAAVARPVFLGLALVFALAALFCFVNLVRSIQVLYDIWPARWF